MPFARTFAETTEEKLGVDVIRIPELALQAQIDVGAASPVLMAWALDVPVDDIDFPEASDDTAAHHQMLIGRPAAADVRAFIHGSDQV